MRELTVQTKEHAYPIIISDSLLREVGERVRALGGDGVTALITDETVFGLYGRECLESLRGAGFSVSEIVVPPGEGSKTLATLEGVYTRLFEAGVRRGGVIVALGGGVVGDLGGFAAASYLRGVRYVQIPTTLLSQVDSGVGGKTAVNLPQGKNLIGAFWQPSLVLIDPSTLATLPERELRCGMAEVVKYGVISSEELFSRVETTVPNDALPEIIHACCAIKSEVVAGDEHDRGERMKLNFGHTFGHALEKRYGFGVWTHGEGVAVGMVMATLVGEALGVTAPGTLKRLREALRQNGLPVSCVADADEIATLMRGDKKAAADNVTLVLPEKIGKAVLYPIEYGKLREIMRRVERAWKTEG